MAGILSSSIARKVAMALSGIFLVSFLALHFIINLTSVFSEDFFNEASHFMGTNPIVQLLLQPILVFGVIFHFVMGFVLELQNRKARGDVGYAMYKGSANSSWLSRNMIISGIVVLLFLGLHFYDFWIPEMVTKYVEGDMTGMHGDTFRYYEETVHKFAGDPIRTGLYVLSFVFLMLHLLHGFSSSFQSVGFNNKYSRGLKGFTKAFAVVVPLGFAFIAIFHYVSHL
ncbi:MAG: succinate dehydrogenase cytochrome b subunit [Kangiellaceae bacterium]|jgi:succinate dehydrogenase / fumarate reductase cytochrome b subunit|nr:succinate dehydrogenase cytochrome b subunit [Kangiellaceae bacterium]